MRDVEDAGRMLKSAKARQSKVAKDEMAWIQSGKDPDAFLPKADVTEVPVIEITVQKAAGQKAAPGFARALMKSLHGKRAFITGASAGIAGPRL